MGASGRRARCGASVAELLASVAICGAVLGSATLAFVRVHHQMLRSTAEAMLTEELNFVADEIARELEIGMSAFTVPVGGRIGVLSAIPNGSDTNGDQRVDTVIPLHVSPDLVEEYTNLNNSAFYFSDATGNAGTPGTQLWFFGVGGVSSRWSLQFGRPRFPLIESLGYVPSLDGMTGVLTVTGSLAIRNPGTFAPAAETNPRNVVRASVTRTVFLRHRRLVPSP